MHMFCSCIICFVECFVRCKQTLQHNWVISTCKLKAVSKYQSKWKPKISPAGTTLLWTPTWMQLCPTSLKIFPHPWCSLCQCAFPIQFFLHCLCSKAKPQPQLFCASLLKAIFQMMAVWHQPWVYKWFPFFLSQYNTQKEALTWTPCLSTNYATLKNMCKAH